MKLWGLLMKYNYSVYFDLQYGQALFFINSLYGVNPKKRLQAKLGHTYFSRNASSISLDFNGTLLALM